MVVSKIRAELAKRSIIQYDLEKAREQVRLYESQISLSVAEVIGLEASLKTAIEIDEAIPEAAQARQQPATQPVYAPPPKPAAATAASKRNPQPPKRRGRPPGRPKKQPEPMGEEETKAGQLWGGKSVEEAAAE